MNGLNKEILRLSLPSILANLTVPLVGMVDIAVAGHLPGGAAAFIGGISVGGLLFNLLYWNFFFLRASTGGLTAQAYGRQDTDDCVRILLRGAAAALLMAALILLLQRPFLALAGLVVESSPRVWALALRYFSIRVWAAPATLSLMAIRGWFVGMQDSLSSMFTDLVVNTVNIAASIVLTLGIGGWAGLGFDGIALGTLVAQYTGLLFALLVCGIKYRRVFAGARLEGWLQGLRGFLSMNADLLLRSLSFTAIYMGFTILAARMGDVLLACSSIMMNILMVFSFFTDGFAYAGEALTGRFIGAGDEPMTRRTVRAVFAWSFALAVVFVGVYHFGGGPLLQIMTSDEGVVSACRPFLPWLLLMPPLGCAAFAWDGIYLGATASRGIRNAMMGALASFLLVWYAGVGLLHPSGPAALHLLLAAYFAHLLFRTVYLTAVYKKYVIKPHFTLC
ncbi:MAG: MATE family efflux transporter [Bacteroidales bacterium]|nr:MATE family efflux transporter [Bacteroidales bacterium]